MLRASLPSPFPASYPFDPDSEPEAECSDAPLARATLQTAGASAKLSRRAKKRKAYDASESGKQRRAIQHHVTSQWHLELRLKANSVQMSMQLCFGALPKGSTSASGSRASAVKEEVDLLCHDYAYRRFLLQGFRITPYM